MSFDACLVKPVFSEGNEAKSLVEQIPNEARGREGRRRNPANWTYIGVPKSFTFSRGYTGHVKQPFGLRISANQLWMLIPQRNNYGKMLDEFGLINMLSNAKSRSEAFAGKWQGLAYS